MQNQSILRYIGAGLAFVIFFIGIAYIAYRFLNRPENITLTAPTPSPTIASTPPATREQRIVLPPAPAAPSFRYIPTATATSRPASSSSFFTTAPVSTSSVDPNLLALRREELAAKAQFDRAKLQADTTVSLAKIEADREKTRLTIQKEEQQAIRAASAASQERTLKAQADSQERSLIAQLTSQANTLRMQKITQEENATLEAYKTSAQYDLARRQLKLQKLQYLTQTANSYSIPSYSSYATWVTR